MTDKDPILLCIAVLGGTGKEGSALAMRWALNGYKVVIGSRDAEKAKQRAIELNQELGGDYLEGMDNQAAATIGNLIVVSVPFAAHKDTLESVKDKLAGKIVVDVTDGPRPVFGEERLFQGDPHWREPIACCWGVSDADTLAAVEAFIERYLAGFLEAAAREG